MPAKHVSARRKNLHILAGIVAEGTVITDTRKQKFFVEREFARGGFGRIYSAHQINGHKYSKKESLVIKVEPCANGPLFTEITVFQRILKMEMLQEWIQKKKLDHLGLPPFISSGIFEHNKESLRFLIMPKYGESLESFRKRSGGKLEKKLALKIAIQCANCLSYMQEQNYVHSDIKADNILCGSSKNFANCVLVDFGLAKMAKNNIDKPDKKKAHNGTLLFTSIDAHRGCDPSFRADLEILLYNLMYWITGSLPWTDSLHSSDEVLFNVFFF
ncbi:unnamed protein product [Dracunculus medinensis]|uniref:non-specific serine/threonine protein kinase n=1 Tax=Dracunculus medinensis TaxID=318479 RepID=A0A0N4UMB9_DRAME|nr:unnamed protein product [Dracunculus medinensis]